MTTEELRALPLFAGLSEEGLERLAGACAEVGFGPGQVLVLPGDPGSGMYVLLDGEVSVEMRGGWHTELGPGAFVGEIALLVPGATRVARVRARTPVRCLSVPRDVALELVEREPALALAMLRELARRLADAAPG